ncbi:3-oxoacyl-[acyl-carrier protein] reductase [Sanguibacter gelidistatuariae]|uniref:3-oxoacyl-[acyl-carrier protein] reductase n=1 Tax=Sanguibacter gelidistatuariae TaxID=1814289 RepID=A0A1G6HDX6_9MICO|nr:3-oxoacyl-ACP reductase [Sanguibacter gelidistatuariae]SDB92479.1 3-oxoacyl-[acyl-carrier protein] reductase [Sanguibacter gelidistatuariae]
MSDSYVSLVNGGLGGTVAKKLGLPRPGVLRRQTPDAPFAPGPVLVLGSPASADADAVAQLILTSDGGADLDIRRAAAGASARWGAVVVVLSDVEHPRDLAAPMLDLSGALRALAPGGRVVTISREATSSDTPSVAAARQGVDGALRSLAKELRAGATGNGIVLAGGVDLTAASVGAALRFFLSPRSAFVDGQLLTVSSVAGEAPGSWDRPLEGRVAVVTGAARGIGAAIARVLARDGARVVVVDVPAAGEALAALANEVRGTALQLDITAPDAGERIIDHAVSRHGGLDIVVHNAGITRDKLLANMSPEQWDSVLAVNIGAQLTINEALLASPAFTRSPRIVSLASTSGIAGNRGQTNYAASKGGVIGMVRATGPLLAGVGGTANAVAPGFIETEMTSRIPFATREVARRLNSLQQAGLPVDVAEAVAFLAGPAAGGINGEVLRVCGQNLVGA